MKSINFLIALVCLVLLNGCMQTTAMLGPAITIGSTGNIYQAGLSYGSNKVLESYTGDNATTHVVNFIEDSNNKKNRKKNFIELVENKFPESRKKFLNSKN